MNALPAGLLLGLLTAGAVCAQMGIPPAVVEQAKASYIPQPPAFTINDKRYAFRQETLEQNFGGCYSLLADRVKTGHKDNDVPASALAYCIIAAGEFAEPTPALTDMLEQVKTTLGKLPVPEAVNWPQKSYLGAASMSFVDEAGDGFDSAGLMQKDKQTFEDLVWSARLKMAIRGTKKAE